MNDDARCKLVEEALPAYLDRQLDEPGSAAVRRHIEGCADCRSALEALRRVEYALMHLPQHVPAESAVSRAVMTKLGPARRSRTAAFVLRLRLELLAPALGFASAVFAVRNLLARALEWVFAVSVVLARFWVEAIERLISAAGSETAVLFFAALSGLLLAAFGAASVITLRIARR